MQTITDARGVRFELKFPAQRVVSLVPSDTETVVGLGAGKALVGRTDYCVEPASVRDLPTVGGTKDASVEQILALKPDLVLANQEENTRDLVHRLEQGGARVFVSFPTTAMQAIGHVATLSRLLFAGRPSQQAKDLVAAGYEQLQVKAGKDAARRPRVFFPIWREPLMTINGETFISDMIERAGGTNIFADRARRYPLAADLNPAVMPNESTGRDVRYPRVTVDELVERAPDIVILPDEPHDFSAEDQAFFEALPIPAAKLGRVIRTSGKDWMWPGMRTIRGLQSTRELLERLS